MRCCDSRRTGRGDADSPRPNSRDSWYAIAVSGAAKSIRALRIRRSLTQRVLADRCEIVQPVIAAYESGARDPGLRNPERIAESLDARVELVTFVDVTALLEEYPGMTRAALLSLALHHEIAAVVLRDPSWARAKAIQNVATMRQADRRRSAQVWFAQWESLLKGPIGALVAAMIDPSSDATDLRQCSPFAGVLDERVRQRLIALVRRAWNEARAHAP